MAPSTLAGRSLAGAATGVAVWLAFVLARHELPGWLRFVVAFGLFLFGPGAAVVWHALPDAPTSRRIVLALGFGVAAAPLLAHLLSAAGLLDLFPYLAAALAGVALSGWSGSSAPRPRASLVGPALLVLVALAIAYVGYANRVAVFPDRTVYYGEYDTFDLTYYAAIASELTHTIPPAAPFHAGHELNHAFYPQLPVAMLRLYAEVPVLDTYFYYIWPVYLALAALMCFVLVESISTPRVAFLSGLLILVGSDLSYLAAWFYPHVSRHWDEVVWSANFLSPGAETLIFNNWTPTLAVVFAGLYALAAHERRPRLVWILAAGACFAVTAQFKPFAFVSLTAALVATAAVSWRDRAALRRLLPVGAVLAAVAAPYVYRIVTLSADAQAALTVDYFTLPRTMLERLSLQQQWLDWTTSLGLSDLSQTIVVGILGTPLFLVGGLGFRLVGLPGLVRCLWRPLQEPLVWRMTAWTIVAAVAAPFVVSTQPVVYETMHFHQLALFLLPIFVARAVMSLDSRTARVAASVLVVAVSVPSTAHYVSRKWHDRERPHATLSDDEVKVAGILRTLPPDRTVLLHNQPRRASLMVIASERRSVLAWGGYVRNTLPRQRDVTRFFRSTDMPESYAPAVLDKYTPTHVLEYPDVDRIHPAVRGRLRPLFESPHLVLYEVCDVVCPARGAETRR